MKSKRVSASAQCALLISLFVFILAGTVRAQPCLRNEAPPAYPLKVSINSRYIVDQNSRPFLLAGDSPQSLIGNISEEDAAIYFANRACLDFNAVWINLLCTTYTYCNANGSTFDGIRPFTSGTNPSNYDLSRPNEAYFKRVDDMINLAAHYGIVVFLDPIETGGWLTTIKNNGFQKDYDYGLYLGERYKNFPNIVWQSGNDFFTWKTDHTANAEVKAVMQGIVDSGDTHLQTMELAGSPDGSLDDTLIAPLVGLDGAYTYKPTYAQVLTNFNRRHFKPAFLIEANYEGGDFFPPVTGTPFVLRHQEYWAMLSGATGQLYGDDDYMVCFCMGWKNHLYRPGAVQFGYLQALFDLMAWWNLVPDQHHTFVTAGYGVFDPEGRDDTNNYVTSAITPDGKNGVAYLPGLSTITVDMSKFSSPVTARWVDPTNHTATVIPGSPFRNSGSKEFSSPGNNFSGDPDWVLVFGRLSRRGG